MTVLVLFLSAEINLALRPKLIRELEPSTRVVSHWHDKGDWKPQETGAPPKRSPCVLWTVP